MAENTQTIFKLINAFFISMKFRRTNEVPDSINIPSTAEFKVINKVAPKRIQVNLRVKTPDDSPFVFDTELVGLFEYIDESHEPDKDIIAHYVLDKGLFMLWPYISQIVRIISGQMGMNPLETSIPTSFNVNPEDLIQAIEERN